RLPRIPERAEAQHREVEDRADRDDPEAMTLEERALEAELVFLPRAERLPEIEYARDERDEAARHDDRHRPRERTKQVCLRDGERAREEHRDADRANERHRQLVHRELLLDAVLGILEGPEEIHDAPR